MKDKNFYKGKNILVAGASGFVGTHLTKKLSDLGANIVGSYLNRMPNQELQNVKYIKADYTNYQDCLTATKNIDYVFMAAANTSGAAVMEKTPLAHLTPNVVMNSQILSAAYENNISKFCFVFGMLCNFKLISLFSFKNSCNKVIRLYIFSQRLMSPNGRDNS